MTFLRVGAVLLVAILAVSLAFEVPRPVRSVIPIQAVSGQTVSGAISTSVFFTNSNLNALTRDVHGNPMVNATMGITQICVSYNSKTHKCGSSNNYYAVQHTSPAQVEAWINITNTSGSPLRALRLNETLPSDWAVSPTWGALSTGAIHAYWANHTRLSTDHEITQYPTISVSGTPQIVHIVIPNFNKTAINHPLFAGETILVSVRMTYTLQVKVPSSVGFPRNYTDAAVAAAWTEASYTGTEYVKSASAFFITYGTVPVTVSPVANFWGSVWSVTAPIIGLAIILTIIFVVMRWLMRVKRKPDFPETRPIGT